MKHSQTYLSLFLFLTSFSFSACSQRDSSGEHVPSVQQHRQVLGSATVVVKEIRYSTEIPIQLVLLHSNEETAHEVASAISSREGIDYVHILNENRRFLEFETGEGQYRFDPNRIFSQEGIAATLRSRSRYSEAAHEEIAGFSSFLLRLIDGKKTVIAVHNNTEGAFTLEDYRKDSTGLVFQNPEQDPDDFFITTDSMLFERIRERNYNVVLEYTDAVKQDGSLSIYCGRNKIPYVNVEAQHGHKKEQEEMLLLLLQILK